MRIRIDNVTFINEFSYNVTSKVAKMRDLEDKGDLLITSIQIDPINEHCRILIKPVVSLSNLDLTTKLSDLPH